MEKRLLSVRKNDFYFRRLFYEDGAKKKLSPVRRNKPKKEGHPDQRTIFPNQYSRGRKRDGILLKIRIIVKYTAFGWVC